MGIYYYIHLFRNNLYNYVQNNKAIILFFALLKGVSFMKRVSLFIIVNAISLYLVSLLMNSMYIGSFGALIILTIIFGALNLTVKPILEFLSLPITFLTLGLFLLIINAIVLKLAFGLVPGVYLYGFVNAIGASILLSIVNTIIYKILD